jgi:phage virion morphogenesis protein
MAEPFEIKINPSDLSSLRGALDRLQQGVRNMGPVMRTVATEMKSQVEMNFAEEGRPKWKDLAESTIAARKKHGHWPGKMEQISAGGLAASTQTDYGPSFAQIGQSKVYAAIQNLGGEAGRGHKVTIPARPSLPIRPDGSLQPETEAALLDEVLGYLERLV